jgi:hypothetical protein
MRNPAALNFRDVRWMSLDSRAIRENESRMTGHGLIFE